ncbi:MAG: hypothetical protein IJQ31_14965 [Thermoguttaceae bacterium]|nr:hypothetical protein [Thermoguttaceae bacterium]
MLYRLENGQPVPVTKVEVDGQIITNPPWEWMQDNGYGYQKAEMVPPSYDPDNERLESRWVLTEDTDCKWPVIVKEYEVVELTTAEKAAIHNAKLDAQIDAVNAGYETYKTTPLTYTDGTRTMLLKPIWVTEYYGTLMQIGLMSSGANFPATITDAAGSNFELTFQEFSTLYLWLVQQAQTEIKRVNDAIAELQAQKEDPDAEL